MSTDDASLFGGEAGAHDWSGFLQPTTQAKPAMTSPSTNNPASPAGLSTPSPSPSSSSATTRSHSRNGARRVANLLTLTELRKAAWARIYKSGISTGDAAISTILVPAWKQFDTLMVNRHRLIAVAPLDNSTLGWIACFDPLPQMSLYQLDDATTVGQDGRDGKTVEIQFMVAESARNRGVGTFLVKAVLDLLNQDTRYSKVQASFFPENEACRKVLEKCDFAFAGSRSNVVRMLDGPRKGEWRDLITYDLQLPPLQPAAVQHPQEEISTAIDTTVDPNALFKRPRLD